MPFVADAELATCKRSVDTVDNMARVQYLHEDVVNRQREIQTGWLPEECQHELETSLLDPSRSVSYQYLKSIEGTQNVR
jgi:hypothetical protein